MSSFRNQNTCWEDRTLVWLNWEQRHDDGTDWKQFIATDTYPIPKHDDNTNDFILASFVSVFYLLAPYSQILDHACSEIMACLHLMTVISSIFKFLFFSQEQVERNEGRETQLTIYDDLIQIVIWIWIQNLRDLELKSNDISMLISKHKVINS